MSKYSLQKSSTEVLKEIADKHRALRKQAKYSQAEMAERSGVSLGTLRRFESTGKISMESFFKLLLVLDRLEEMENILLPEENTDGVEKLFSKEYRKS